MTAHYLQLRYLNCWLACAKAESDNRCAMKPSGSFTFSSKIVIAKEKKSA